MNSGIRDVINIACKLVLVLRGQADEAILDSYETERRADLERKTMDSIKLGDLVMVTNPAIAYIRDVILGVVSFFEGSALYTTLQYLVRSPEADIVAPKALIARGVS